MSFTRRHALGLAASASAALLTKQSVFAQSSADGITGNPPSRPCADYPSSFRPLQKEPAR